MFWSRTQWSNYMYQALRGLNLQPWRFQPLDYSMHLNIQGGIQEWMVLTDSVMFVSCFSLKVICISCTDTLIRTIQTIIISRWIFYSAYFQWLHENTALPAFCWTNAAFLLTQKLAITSWPHSSKQVRKLSCTQSGKPLFCLLFWNTNILKAVFCTDNVEVPQIEVE